VHEIGLCQSVLSVVEEQAAGSRVTGVRLRVGALHRVSPEAFDQNFSLVAAGSLADGATVEVVIVPVTAPVAVGLNVAVMVQLAPAARLVPQVLAWVNSVDPLTAMLEIVNVTGS